MHRVTSIQTRLRITRTRGTVYISATSSATSNKIAIKCLFQNHLDIEFTIANRSSSTTFCTIRFDLERCRYNIDICQLVFLIDSRQCCIYSVQRQNVWCKTATSSGILRSKFSGNQTYKIYWITIFLKINFLNAIIFLFSVQNVLMASFFDWIL